MRELKDLSKTILVPNWSSTQTVSFRWHAHFTAKIIQEHPRQICPHSLRTSNRYSSKPDSTTSYNNDANETFSFLQPWNFARTRTQTNKTNRQLQMPTLWEVTARPLQSEKIENSAIAEVPIASKMACLCLIFQCENCNRCSKWMPIRSAIKLAQGCSKMLEMNAN